MAIFTLENSCELQNPGGKSVEVPKLKGTTIEFADHVPGRASYASISKTGEKPSQGGLFT